MVVEGEGTVVLLVGATPLGVVVVLVFVLEASSGTTPHRRRLPVVVVVVPVVVVVVPVVVVVVPVVVVVVVVVEEAWECNRAAMALARWTASSAVVDMSLQKPCLDLTTTFTFGCLPARNVSETKVPCCLLVCIILLEWVRCGISCVAQQKTDGVTKHNSSNTR